MPRKRRMSISTTITNPMDLSMLKLSDLKSELWMRGLVTTGNKSQLVARLEAALLTPPQTKKQKVKRASPSTPVNYSKMKVANLRKKLESHGLDTSGRKSELVDRLQGSIGGGALKGEPMEEDLMEETDFSKAKRASTNSLVDYSKLNVAGFKEHEMKVTDLKRNQESRQPHKSGNKVKFVSQCRGDIRRGALLEEDKLEVKHFRKANKASPSAPIFHSKIKVADMKKELKFQGLGTSGRKAELVDRLQGGIGDAMKEETDFSNANKASPSAPVNYSKMNVADLRKKLEFHGLNTSGRKAELIDRLQGGIGGAMKEETGFSNANKASPYAPINYSKMNVADLRKELEFCGLDTSGKKAELVDRLQGSIAGGALKEETDFSKTKQALKVGTSRKNKKKGTKDQKVDSHYYEVFEDWDCMLNQTNIDHDNNNFYAIQIRKDKSRNAYKLWSQWGGVGEFKQSFEWPITDLENVKKNFRKKFMEKTMNKWEDRKNFTPVPCKYILIERDKDDNDEPKEMKRKLAALNEAGSAPVLTSLPCSLDKSTQALIQLIFNADMFNYALKSMDLDTKKMPLGKLSKIQISKGIEALEAIETALDACQNKFVLMKLTSKFYSIIPHILGYRPPPTIVDRDMLQIKFDMLEVLGDIEIAQGLQQGKARIKSEVATEVPHELDVQYVSLNASLELLNHRSHEYKVISKYITSTAHLGMQLLDVWRVGRHGVDDRFKEHDAINNRRLLWHGTNIAMVATSLKYGLRIMPHSGGRVGRGIYLASENSKSIAYMRPARDGTGIMFLNEAVLGKEYHITIDDCSLTAPPTHYDCIIAKGRTEPDPRYDTELMLGGKKVIVPQGKPISTSFTSSSFYQSEYLIYRESQTRIRYMIKIKF